MANAIQGVGAANGSAPELQAYGDTDANVDIKLVPKGTGEVINNGIKQSPYYVVTWNIPGGATAADYDGLAFIANRAYELVEVRERHRVAGSDGGAVTLMMKKVPSGTAPSAGTDMLSAGLNLKSAIDTIQNGSVHGTAGNRQLAAGDAVAFVPTGTLTAVDGVTVQFVLKPI